jgi:D-3-phosphoglycerate dehydrogenase / 2-oxoglutarate reductase
MKILISDKLSDEGKKILQSKGLEFDDKSGLTPDQLKEIISEYDGLIIRSATKVTADIISAAKKLKVVGRAGVGVDNVDVPAATQKGILVMNTPEGNTVSTAQLTFSMLLALSRNIPQADASMKTGAWEKTRFKGTEVTGKTLGIIGLGRIGTVVMKYAKAFGMSVLVYDPFLTKERAEQLNVAQVTLDEIFAKSDYITVHTPKTRDTTGIVNAEAIKKMKKGVRIINCARGGIVDEEALLDGLKSGKVGGAALDVFTKEPPEGTALTGLQNLIATPHLGASTTEAQEQVAVDIAHQIADYLTTGKVVNAVNMPSMDETTYAKMKPYIMLSEKLGSFTSQVVTGTVKAIDIYYSGMVNELDVSSLTRGAVKGFLESMLEGDVNFINALILAKERGIKINEIKTTDSEDFSSLITIKAATEENGVFSISGTVFGKRMDPRIVRINSYHVDAYPVGCLLLITNKDTPGAIGKIGMTLGSHGINIADMTLGRKAQGDKAVIVLNIDGAISDNVVQAVKDLPEVIEVTTIYL